MVRRTLWNFLVDQWTTLPAVSQYQVDLTGKTVVITGANTGLGLAAAKHFARLGPQRLIIGCRDSQKASAAVTSIREETGFDRSEAWPLDLASFASVRAFANRFEREGGGHLDIFVGNAGALFVDYAKTVDGWERSLQVNHLGPSLLIFLLLPYLMKAPASPPTPRIVILSSETHFVLLSLPEAKYPNILEKLNDEQYWKASKQPITSLYPIVKLMAIFFTRSLASRLATPPAGSLTVTCVNPGFCRTELTRGMNILTRFIVHFGEWCLARTTEVGSRTIMWAALAGRQGEVHGRYTSACRVEEESDLVLSKEGADIEERLWMETLEILIQIDGRVKSYVEEYLECM
ncbi:hypothetical protein BU17DRAFT_49532 [Hysterangium stoloniferum]|nr:hypothetical protein BU17DRAFT_49532 [Hysterangium stoloniferum]